MAELQGLLFLFGQQLGGGTNDVIANLSVTLDSVVLASDVTVTPPNVDADLNITIDPVILASDASVSSSIDADLSVTLDPVVLSSDATILTAITADLSVTLPAVLLSSDASITSPITADLSVTLDPVTLSSDASVVNPTIIIDDTHDGDFLGKKFKRERKAVAARRQRVLDLYEQIVEGKQPEPEVVALVEAAGIAAVNDIIEAPAISLNSLIASLEQAQVLARDLAIEADDEEVLLLL